MAPRERDALVATRLMGWTDLGSGLIAQLGTSSPKVFHAGAEMVPPCYSADMTAAWQVVQRMAHEPFAVRCHFLDTCLPETVSAGKALLGDTRPGWPDVLFLLQPSDICLAALHACGVAIEP